MDFGKIYEAPERGLIFNEFGEKWVKLGNGHPASGKACDACAWSEKWFSKIGYMGTAEVDNGDHYIAFYHGGRNGGGPKDRWSRYLDDLKTLLSLIPGSYVIELSNDCCDDVWEVAIGFRMESE